jgi:site-specific recombinase XerC
MELPTTTLPSVPPCSATGFTISTGIDRIQVSAVAPVSRLAKSGKQPLDGSHLGHDSHARARLKADDDLFPCRSRASPHLGTRQHARVVEGWVEEIGLDPAAHGTHSIRRTKPTLIYRRTKNLRAVQVLHGHTKLESTVRYLGIEVDDALEIAEQTEV